MSSSSNPDKQEIESLRAQLEAEKTRNSKSANGSQPAQRRLLEKQEAPLPFVMKEDIVDRAVNPQTLRGPCVAQPAQPEFGWTYKAGNQCLDQDSQEATW